jgi:hypothetical protein
MVHFLILAAAGLLAGAMNAIAGGGSFVTFPVLVFLGLPAVTANASSTIALFPGTMTSAITFRDQYRSDGPFRLAILGPISFVGGLLGAVLLLATSARVFDAIVPWLLLLATITFAVGPQVGLKLRRHMTIGPSVLPVVQFVIAIYGGYFGGAVGLMMMASWVLITASADLRAMAPSRVFLVSAANGAAVLWFIAAGAVRWPETLAMLGASVIGGYFGARLTNVLPREWVRAFVLVLTAGITLVFFLRMR